MLENTFNDYKNKIMMQLIEDEELVKALINTSTDFISDEVTVPIENIPYNYIYPYKNSREIFKETRSAITMQFKDFAPSRGNSYKDGYVIFYIVCHIDIVRTDYGNRHDFIYERIKKCFDNTRILGMGNAIITNISDLEFGNDDYCGMACTLSFGDFK